MAKVRRLCCLCNPTFDYRRTDALLVWHIGDCSTHGRVWHREIEEEVEQPRDEEVGATPGPRKPVARDSASYRATDDRLQAGVSSSSYVAHVAHGNVG